MTLWLAMVLVGWLMVAAAAIDHGGVVRPFRQEARILTPDQVADGVPGVRVAEGKPRLSEWVIVGVITELVAVVALAAEIMI